MVHVFYILHFRCMNRDVKNKQFKIFKKSVLYYIQTKKGSLMYAMIVTVYYVRRTTENIF